MDCMIKYIHVKLQDNVSDIKCPSLTCECSALMINECGGGGSLKRCVCPSCKKPFCFRCKVPWHVGYACEDSRETMDQNDVAFGVLSERKKWMRCPKCRHCVELVKGCEIVRCR
ncbi:putative IBR domain, E3 ubiquitin ligase RBR family, TRIAD supradomain-containing protein [Helianthus annuus]|nr:putative IBR domain, E3 ubiquitin ligase RBR family, TRIAD supradomain-containing protein [Helianthus annuus]